ncbi:MAG TPA: CPBP family intramembrane metalloprotease, partial [Saprospiraceae bacterium]|nr:CPBP family intramembrane metalloprotease [Saprospiraceae bacterium]
AYIFFYYLVWEFYFRGFLLFGLAKIYGPAAAILIQTISSCLVHLGKPEGETLGSVAAGLLFGLLALRTGSIWYGWLIHFSLGVMTDFFILRNAGVSLF